MNHSTNGNGFETIVGIDLGTTNSEIAVVRDGRVEVIPVAGAARTLPSTVGIGEDGSLLVGQPARNQYAAHPERTVRSIKRRMGESARVSMAGKDHAQQKISAVIAVPAIFSDAQRQATREASEIAGLEVVRIINEPTAAALAYESRHQGARKALVYDLGGDDFDRKLVDFALAHLQGKHKPMQAARRPRWRGCSAPQKRPRSRCRTPPSPTWPRSTSSNRTACRCTWRSKSRASSTRQ